MSSRFLPLDADVAVAGADDDDAVAVAEADGNDDEADGAGDPRCINLTFFGSVALSSVSFLFRSGASASTSERLERLDPDRSGWMPPRPLRVFVLRPRSLPPPRPRSDLAPTVPSPPLPLLLPRPRPPPRPLLSPRPLAPAPDPRPCQQADCRHCHRAHPALLPGLQ
jgi:hypothetical protein